MTATVPRITRLTPPSIQPSIEARVRTPPPSCTGIETAPRMLADRLAIDRPALDRAVQVDHVQPGKALLLEQGGLVGRRVVEHGLLVQVAVQQTHAAPVLQIDGRIKDHAGVSRKFASSLRPWDWDFSG